jgi:hypothetical protein
LFLKLITQEHLEGAIANTKNILSTKIFAFVNLFFEKLLYKKYLRPKKQRDKILSVG